MTWPPTSSRKPSRKSLVVVLFVKKPKMALCSTLVLRRRLVDGNALRARRTNRGSFPDTAFSICFTCSLMSEEEEEEEEQANHLRAYNKWQVFIWTNTFCIHEDHLNSIKNCWTVTWLTLSVLRFVLFHTEVNLFGFLTLHLKVIIVHP